MIADELESMADELIEAGQWLGERATVFILVILTAPLWGTAAIIRLLTSDDGPWGGDR